MSPFALLNCYIDESVQKKQKFNNIKIRIMDELFALLIPLGCGCVLPILVIWLTIRKEMNETNTRTKIVLAAIEKTPDMNIEELIEKISPKKKLLKETLLEKLMWGWICAILGPGLIGLGIYLKIEGMGRPKDPLVAICFGVVLLAVGIAFLVNYYLGRKMLAKEIEAEEKRVTTQQA